MWFSVILSIFSTFWRVSLDFYCRQLLWNYLFSVTFHQFGLFSLENMGFWIVFYVNQWLTESSLHQPKEKKKQGKEQMKKQRKSKEKGEWKFKRKRKLNEKKSSKFFVKFWYEMFPMKIPFFGPTLMNFCIWTQENTQIYPYFCMPSIKYTYIICFLEKNNRRIAMQPTYSNRTELM